MQHEKIPKEASCKKKGKFEGVILREEKPKAQLGVFFRRKVIFKVAEKEIFPVSKTDGCNDEDCALGTFPRGDCGCDSFPEERTDEDEN